MSERERGGDTQREKASKIEKKYIEIKSRNRGREGEMSERERSEILIHFQQRKIFLPDFAFPKMSEKRAQQ